MRKNLLSMVVCLAAMTLAITSCSKHDTEQGGGKGVLSLASANIKVEPSTKTEYHDLETSMEVIWEQSDMFSAYNSANASNTSYWVTRVDGRSASFEGKWDPAPAEGDMIFAAYLGGSGWMPNDYRAISISLTDQTGQLPRLKNKDFMRARAQYNSQGATRFEFSHRVAVVKLVLTFPEGVTGDATNVGLKATGLSQSANLDLTVDDGGEYYKDKTAGDVNTGTNAIAIDEASRTLTAYLCVLPEALSAVKVTATVGSDTYEASVGDNTLKAGRMYTVKKEMKKPVEAKFAFTINASDSKYTLPFNPDATTGTYTLTVNWGDGASQTIDPNTSLSTPIAHDYTTAGPFQITISSSEADPTKVQMPEFKPGKYNTADKAKLTSVDASLLNNGNNEFKQLFRIL